jgi:hypothetical protein
VSPRCLGLTIVFASGSAAAATFPADTAYVPLRCGGAPMTDALADDPPALIDRDLVGDVSAPTGLRASDDQNLYLRIRLDGDPAPGGAIRPFAWGMELDLDGDLATYELLLIVDGLGGVTAGKVSVFTNHTTTLANDPSDPADAPAAATFMYATTGRTIASGTSYGGNPDFFLDYAIPWSALTPLGLDRDTPTYVWAGSSTVADGLDGDLACQDGRTGAAHLDATASDPTTGDPTQDPAAAGGLRLEGGGGCSTGRGGSWLIAIAALLGLRRRRPC